MISFILAAVLAAGPAMQGQVSGQDSGQADAKAQTSSAPKSTASPGGPQTGAQQSSQEGTKQATPQTTQQAPGQSSGQASGTGTGMPTSDVTPASASAATSATPAARRAMPQAKTQDEFTAYNVAASQPDPAQEEKAIADFVVKFPTSELTPLLYRDLMQKYQAQNKPEKTLEAGHKLLAIDPDNPLALVLTATVTAESTRATDIDHDARYDEATKDAKRALETTNTSLLLPPSVTPEQEQQLKNVLLSMAHATLGFIQMNRDDYAGAEKELKQSLGFSGVDPDAMNYLRLGISQDHENKLAEAMANTDKAIQIATSQNNPQIASLARNEKDRLTKLMGAAAPAKP